MKHKIDMVIGSNVRRLRRSKGLSQMGVAMRLSPPVNPSCVGKIENGAVRIHTQHLEQISTLLGVKITDLLEGA